LFSEKPPSHLLHSKYETLTTVTQLSADMLELTAFKWLKWGEPRCFSKKSITAIISTDVGSRSFIMSDWFEGALHCDAMVKNCDCALNKFRKMQNKL
jgi:beta-glucosidase-like glycosyl hydrolase